MNAHTPSRRYPLSTARDAGSVLPPDSRAGDTSSVLADLNRAKCVFQLRGVVAAMGIDPNAVSISRNGEDQTCRFIDMLAIGHAAGHPVGEGRGE